MGERKKVAFNQPGKNRNAKCPCGSGLKYKNCHLRSREGYNYDTLNKRWEKAREITAYNLGRVIGGKTPGK